RRAHVIEPAWVCVNDGAGALEPGGVGGNAQVGFDPASQTVFADQRACECVVCGYGRLTGLVGLALAGLQLGQIGADARCQLGCRLISERETQYLLRGCALMTDEPHDARRHDRGLTPARPRNDCLGLTPVSGDRFKLRIGEIDADDLPQLIALADGTPGAHEWPPMIQAPSGWAGQAARNSQVRHRSGDGVAGKSSRRMWPAAADTCCHAGESSSRAACFCTFGSSGALAPHGIRNCTKEAPPLVAPGATSPVPP